MPETAPVLIVDSDLAVLQKAEALLHRAGHEVAVATDGALAINKALAAPPQLIVTAVEMPLLDGFKLCQLLRTNPLTRDIPFLFLTTKETSTVHLGRYLRPSDEFLLKPFREEELVARVGVVLGRGKGGRAPAEDQQRLLGTLSEISLMDLLQVLRMNRRSGLLELESEGRRGTIFISAGEVLDAEVGKFRGEKAFFRTLEWTGGKFEFRPQPVTAQEVITRPGENLILEGLRQLDEVNRLREALAPRGTRLELLRRFEGPPERLRPVTREVLKLLEYFSSLGDLLDQSAFSDLEICQALHSLLEKKVIAVSRPRPESRAAAAAQALLSLEEALKLSYHLGVGREEGTRAWSGKVLLIAEDHPLLRSFLEGISRLKEFRIDATVVLGHHGDSVPLGPVGTLQILEGTEVLLYCLPGAPHHQPLWESLAHGAVGGVALTHRFPPFPAFAETCDRALRRPFLVCGPELEPPARESLPRGAWLPSVPWAVSGYRDGREEDLVAAFRTFFSLILTQ